MSQPEWMTGEDLLDDEDDDFTPASASLPYRPGDFVVVNRRTKRRPKPRRPDPEIAAGVELATLAGAPQQVIQRKLPAARFGEGEWYEPAGDVLIRLAGTPDYRRGSDQP